MVSTGSADPRIDLSRRVWAPTHPGVAGTRLALRSCRLHHPLMGPISERSRSRFASSFRMDKIGLCAALSQARIGVGQAHCDARLPRGSAVFLVLAAFSKRPGPSTSGAGAAASRGRQLSLWRRGANRRRLLLQTG